MILIAQDSVNRICVTANITAGTYSFEIRITDPVCEEIFILDLGDVAVCACRFCDEVTHDCQGTFNLDVGIYNYEIYSDDVNYGSGKIKIIL